MITLVEPMEPIARLWGKQRIIDGEIFRMMRYVLRTKHDGKVLLHNVVTGQLVALTEDEADEIEMLPASYTSVLEQLIADHYLVPECYDEHEQVMQLRMVMQKYNNVHSTDAITKYTILPTTACNARCYYCFEQGQKPMTMSEAKANEVVEFVKNHCGTERKISIMWFGGEPTVATHRMDQICKGLRENNIQYTSAITTNGLLLDEGMISKAKYLWNLRIVKISVDGTEKTYNEVKNYVCEEINPYKKVMNNIEHLLDKGITVNLRMNFDVENFREFETLVRETYERFGKNPLFHLHAHPVNGEYTDRHGRLSHGSESWFNDKLAELNGLAREYGLLHNPSKLPCLRFDGCIASDRSAIVITPEGNLAKCPEQFDPDSVLGNLADGITRNELADSWSRLADHSRCIDCVYYPYCDRLQNCSAQDRCGDKLDYTQKYQASMKQYYRSYMEQKGGI